MSTNETKLATFGAGCFWGVEVTFRNIEGVVDAQVGYGGGHVSAPTYEQVCTDTTGHAEVVQVEYDPAIVPYEELLAAFWDAHDPTQVDRQGPDVGTQYRSVIFVHDDEQRRAAIDSKKRLDAAGRLPFPIATHIEDAPTFWPAEEYHQNYLVKAGRASCRLA